MIRLLQRAIPAFVVLALAASGAVAKEEPKTKPAADKAHSAKAKPAGKAKPADKSKADAAKGKKSEPKKSEPKKADGKGPAGKSAPVGRFGEWDVFATAGKAKTCYTLARPKDRAPASLKRDDAYVFISNRPAENVQNEVSVIMGFAMKDGSEPTAQIDATPFQFVAKGSNAWLKNPAEEGKFIEAMKKGSKLVVKASSTRGHTSIDTYSLAGITEALARVRKECQ